MAFPAYCLQVSLRHRLRLHAPGLTARAVLENFATPQMLDGLLPTVVSPGGHLTVASAFAVILEHCGIGIESPACAAGDVHRLTTGLGNLECTLVGSR